jgi:hypothetical protein
MHQFSLKQIQDAFVQGDITIEQFIEILIDNFGRKKAKKILEFNLKIALIKEKENGKHENQNP